MFLKYFEQISEKKENKKRIVEKSFSETKDPSDVLRQYGIKIKVCKPHSKGLEISLFEDPNNLDLEKILKDFTFFVKDSKIYVEYA